jgi:hypothetical protein
MDAIFAGVDMAAAATFASAIGLVAIGLAMTWRAVVLGRKGVNQVK